MKEAGDVLTLEEKFQARDRRVIPLCAASHDYPSSVFTAANQATRSDRQCVRSDATSNISLWVFRLPPRLQSGTGVNLTPPPPSLVAPRALERARSRIARAAEALGIEGFARLDAFLQCDTGEVVVIEANAVPGMTPSTVLFHQALAEEPPVPPGEFLKRALDSGLARRRRRMQQRSRSSVDTK